MSVRPRRTHDDHLHLSRAQRSAALYKAMGGFATNGVNMTKLKAISSAPHRDAVLCRHRRASR